MRLQDCQDAREHAQKASKLRRFRENNFERNNDELFEVYRLLLPQVFLQQGSPVPLYLLSACVSDFMCLTAV